MPNPSTDPLLITQQLLKEGKFEAVKNYLLEAQKLSPQDAKIAIQLGITYANTQEYEKAIAAFSLASKLEPLDPTSLYNLGLIQALIGNHREAIHHYK